MAQHYSPDPMTPAWSRALALVQSSPYWWRDWDHPGDAETQRRDTFIDQASQYATYEDMPGDLKATYDAAHRVKQVAISQQHQRQQRHSEHGGHRGHRHR